MLDFVEEAGEDEDCLVVSGVMTERLKARCEAKAVEAKAVEEKQLRKGSKEEFLSLHESNLKRRQSVFVVASLIPFDSVARQASERAVAPLGYTIECNCVVVLTKSTFLC